MNFSAASLKKKKPKEISQPKNKNLQKNELQLCQLIAAAVKKKNRDIRRNNKSLFKL
jgi:hypothetical protein